MSARTPVQEWLVRLCWRSMALMIACAWLSAAVSTELGQVGALIGLVGALGLSGYPPRALQPLPSRRAPVLYVVR